MPDSLLDLALMTPASAGVIRVDKSKQLHETWDRGHMAARGSASRDAACKAAIKLARIWDPERQGMCSGKAAAKK